MDVFIYLRKTIMPMQSNLLFRAITILTFICNMVNYIQSAVLVQNIYKKIDVGGISSTNTNIKANVRSLTECALLCRGSSGCGSIEFESQSKTCTLQSWPRITYSSGGNEKKIWMTGDVKVFFATRQDGDDMTYNQAEKLCSKFGARVPTPQQMYDALDAGLNVCRCAWTQGGIIRLVITQPDPDCPNTYGQQGVLSCKWVDKAADTFCTFN